MKLGEELKRVVVFSLTLPYCQGKRFWPSLDSSQASALEAIEEGFHYFVRTPYAP